MPSLLYAQNCMQLPMAKWPLQKFVIHLPYLFVAIQKERRMLLRKCSNHSEEKVMHNREGNIHCYEREDHIYSFSHTLQLP